MAAEKNKGGRPRTLGDRGQLRAYRLSESDIARLKTFAAAQGVCDSEALRRLIRLGTPESPLPTPQG